MPVYNGKDVYYWMLKTRSSSLDSNPGLKAIGTNAVPYLARALNTPPTFFDRFGWLRDPKVQAACTNLGLSFNWTHPARELRSAAAYSLVAFGFQAEPALAQLHQALTDPTLDDQTRQMVVWSLREIGPPAESLPFLLAAWPLTTNTLFWPVRHDLLLTIASMATNAPARCLPLLLSELKDLNAEMRSVAAFGLGELGPIAHEAVPTMQVLLAGTNLLAQLSAVLALGRITNGLAPVIPLLQEMERGTNARVTAAAALTLWRWGQPASESISILTNLLWQKEAKGSAASYLGEIGPAAKAVVPALLQASQQDIGAWVDQYDRARCALAVLQIDGPDDVAVRELEGALQFRQNPWVRGAVARDLSRLGKLSQPLLPALRRNAHEDSDADVRHAAAIALETIEQASNNGR